MRGGRVEEVIVCKGWPYIWLVCKYRVGENWLS